MVSNKSNWDVYIYSAVFLYRHSIELLLKETIWMSNYLLGKGKTFPKTHRLTDLWEVLKSNAVTLLDSDFPLNETEIQSVETTLQEIIKHDLESDSFRYPYDKKMKRPHPDVTHVNVKELYERFNSIHKYLGRLSSHIDSLYNTDASQF
jgi:HEPN domain-containing protein